MRQLDPPASSRAEIVLLPPRAVEIGPCAWSPDGARLLAGEVLRGVGSIAQVSRLGSLRLYLWSIESGALEVSWPAHDSEIVACDISPDGRLAASMDREGVVALWSLHPCEQIGLRALDRPFPNRDLCRFAPDGRLLLASTRGGLVVLEGEQLTTIATLPSAYCAAWFPSGSRIAAWVNDREGLALRLFDPLRDSFDQLVARLESGSDPGEPTSVVVAPDESEIDSAFSSGAILGWGLDSSFAARREIARLDGRCFVLARAGDRESLWVGLLHRGVWLVDLLSGVSRLVTSRPVSQMAISRRGSDLAVTTSAPCTLLALRKDSTTVVPSPIVADVDSTGTGGETAATGGTRLVVAAEAGELRWIDEPSGRVLATLGSVASGLPPSACRELLRAFAVSPDGERLFDAVAGELRGRDDRSPRASLRAFSPQGRPRCCGFSPSGDQIVVGGGYDPREKFPQLAPVGWAGVWDAETLESVCSFCRHADVVRFCAFTRDARRVVSADASGVVRYWDAVEGREIAVFETGQPPETIEARPGDVLRLTAGTQATWEVELVEAPAIRNARSASP